jgi:hypothetical protein
MKARRLDKYCQGWRRQKYMRKLASRKRRRMEAAMIRSSNYEAEVPVIPARGYAS